MRQPTPSHSRLALALAFALALTTPGCGFLLTTIIDASRGPPAPLTQSQHVSGATSGGSARYPMSCGAASGSPQIAFHFVAPQGAAYTFDSTTSDYDGVIAVFDASGNQLACNDDHGTTRASEVIVTLAQGQDVTVVQGGYAGGSGHYDLWVSSQCGSAALTLADGTVVTTTPTTPPQDIAADTSVQGDTTGLGAVAGVSCPPMSAMQEWRFTAPQDGAFLFQVDSGYDAYLGILDSAGTQLVCNDDWTSTTHARGMIELASGQTARVIVGGFASQYGAYSLTAVTLSTGGSLALGRPVLFAAGNTDTEPDVCGAMTGSVDRTFMFTPRQEAFYAFTTDASGVLVIGDGRRTAACVPLVPDRRAGFVLKAGHRYSLVLELGVPDGSAHTFAIDRADPAAADWQVPPQPPPIGTFIAPAVAEP
jgi:hypothetical protein